MPRARIDRSNAQFRNVGRDLLDVAGRRYFDDDAKSVSARRGLGMDPTAVQRDDAATDREPEAAAAVVGVGGEANEAVEHPLALLGRKTGAFIRDADAPGVGRKL